MVQQRAAAVRYIGLRELHDDGRGAASASPLAFRIPAMLEHRFEEFRLTGNLPSPTGVGLAILRITQAEDASLDDLVAVLQTDPTLTGRILKLANSGERTGQYPATTVRSAAMRLGFANVRNISLGFSLLAGNRTGRCRGFDYDTFWAHSLAVAVAAQTIAERRGKIAPSDGFTCGLLSGMGRLALASVHPTEYESVLARARGQSSARLAEIEHERFGTHHREIAAAMLADWKLPGSFVDAVGFVGSGASPDELSNPGSRQMAHALQTARDLARALTIAIDATPEEARRVMGELQRMADREGLDEAALSELWTVVSASWRTWGDSVQIRAQSQVSLDDLRRRAEPEVRATPSPVLSLHAGLRILLAGLGPAVHDALSNVLGPEGHAVSTADDGETALLRAQELTPHMLISAWDVPGLPELDLVRRLRASEIEQRVHTIVVAGHDEHARLHEAVDAGVDECIHAPIDPRLLLVGVRAVQRLVSLSGQVQELLNEREVRVRQLTTLARKLEIAGITDALTGLYNRRLGLEQLEREASAARNAGRSLSVVLIDIDRFKSINDEHGHVAGDEVLSQTAKLLRGTLRKGDTLARISGDELLAICPTADLDAADKIAERLLVAVRGNVIRTGTFEGSVTISLGVAELDPAEASVDALVNGAQQRLALAKERGRDRAVIRDATGPLRRRA
jgi:diguanylate cyclase (GGDEF)-like protein